MNCTECKFFKVVAINTENQKFECRRYAPRVIHGAGTGWADQSFAFIADPLDTLCGEFEEAQDG
jgi:hypothetical protein